MVGNIETSSKNEKKRHKKSHHQPTLLTLSVHRQHISISIYIYNLTFGEKVKQEITNYLHQVQS